MGNEFIWSEHIGKIVTTALLSMLPAFEGATPVSVAWPSECPWWAPFSWPWCFSTLPMPFVFWLLKPILRWMYALPVGFIQRFAAWVERRSLRKGEKVDTGSLLGLFLFVAVPLPGTGVWTGSAIATLLNMKKSHAMVAIFLGNVAACLIMTLLSAGVLHFF